MSKIAIITSVDYELFGDGSGDVFREQITTTNSLINIANLYNVKLTIMFEYGQYKAYMKYAKENKKFLEDNKKISEQLISLIQTGHDVQLHYHAQWHNAVYNQKENKFHLNLEHVDISTLEYQEILSVLQEGKKFLEKLLKPYKSDYQCIGFRAGSWAVKDQKKLLKALKESNFRSDTSVLPNTEFESGSISFKYDNCPHQYHYWYVDTSLSKAGSDKNFIEIPIYTKKYRFAFLKYLNYKYFMSKHIVNKIYKIKISDTNVSFYKKIKNYLSRDYYMADLNTISYKTLIKMIEDVINEKKFQDEDIVPVMLISHSKNSYGLDDLNLFFDYLAKNYTNKIEYWTFKDTILHLTITKNENCN